jgi:hypothetical protein
VRGGRLTGKGVRETYNRAGVVTVKRVSAVVFLFALSTCVFAASACGDDGANAWQASTSVTPSTTDVVHIDEIDPSSATIGDEITIRGRGFDAQANDIGFVIPHAQGSFKIAYITGYPSPDGETLRFKLDETLGACAFTQLGSSMACPDIGLFVPIGDTTAAVYNRAGTSNSVPFRREQSELEAAQDAVNAAAEMSALREYLDEVVRGSAVVNGQITKSVGYGVQQDDDGTVYLEVTVHGVPESEVRQHVPAEVAGYEVRLTVN